MKILHNIDVIVVSKHAPTEASQKELLKWMTTSLQTVIDQQLEATKKVFLRFSKDTPAIFMS